MEVIIIGAGGHGSEVQSYLADIASLDPSVRLVGFVDENKPRGEWNDARILGDFTALAKFLRENEAQAFHYITAAGDNRVRRDLVNKVRNLQARNIQAWSLRHPRAIIGAGNSLGSGICAAPGSVVTTRARIGDHCILNVHASVSHDSVIGDFVNINPGAVIAGNVRVGDGAYIGAGATVIENVSIGEWAVIGAGSVVIDDIPPHSTAVGVPARVIKRQGWKEQRIAAR